VALRQRVTYIDIGLWLDEGDLVCCCNEVSEDVGGEGGGDLDEAALAVCLEEGELGRVHEYDGVCCTGNHAQWRAGRSSVKGVFGKYGSMLSCHICCLSRNASQWARSLIARDSWYGGGNSSGPGCDISKPFNGLKVNGIEEPRLSR
jgi:hypothetical protein